MPRDPVLFQPILIAGFCILVCCAACDRQPQPRRADRPSTQFIESPDHQDSFERIADSEGATGASGESVVSGPTPAKLLRPDDRRVAHDEKRLAAAGVLSYESKRLKLYTDLPPDLAINLTELIDEVYVAWEDYFGPLPADRLQTDFQISGYVMRDMALFRGLGLIPEDLSFEHGSHLQNEFWMRDQQFDYYRRHLLIHEATHCFMTFMPGVDAPRWYLEGMAEYFAAHRLSTRPEGTRETIFPAIPAQFRIMPTSPNDFSGFGRISIIRKDVTEGRLRSIPNVLALRSAEFVTPNPYAWSWALCAFLDGTPRYRDRFQKLGQFTTNGQFPREFARLFDQDERDLATEWNLFVTNLQYGYDISRAAIDFKAGEPLTGERTQHTVDIAADRGWQSSEVRLQKGSEYLVSAAGRFTLTTFVPGTKAWECEPQGISFRYFDGRPLGTLIGCLRSDEGEAGAPDNSMLSVITVGRESTFQAPVTGTLYLRLNDAWNSLQDNQGSVSVMIRQRPTPSP